MPTNSRNSKYRRSSASRMEAAERAAARRAEDEQFWAAIRGKGQIYAANQQSVDAFEKASDLPEFNYKSAYERSRAHENKRVKDLIDNRSRFMAKYADKLSTMSETDYRRYVMRMDQFDDAIARHEQYSADYSRILGSRTNMPKDNPFMPRVNDLRLRAANLERQQNRIAHEIHMLQMSGLDSDANTAELYHLEERRQKINRRLQRTNQRLNAAASRAEQYSVARKGPVAVRALSARVQNAFTVAGTRVKTVVHRGVSAVGTWVGNTAVGRAFRRIGEWYSDMRFAFGMWSTTHVVMPLAKAGDAVMNGLGWVREKISAPFRAAGRAIHNSAPARGLRHAGRAVTKRVSGVWNSRFVSGIRNAFRTSNRLARAGAGMANGLKHGVRRFANGIHDGITRWIVRPIGKTIFFGVLAFSLIGTALGDTFIPAPIEDLKPDPAAEAKVVYHTPGIVSDPSEYNEAYGHEYFELQTQAVQSEFMGSHHVLLSSADVVTTVESFVDPFKLQQLTGKNYMETIDSLLNEDTNRTEEILRMYLKQANYGYTYLHRDWNDWLTIDDSGNLLVASDPDTTANQAYEWPRGNVVGTFHADEIDTYTGQVTRTLGPLEDDNIDLSFADSVEEEVKEETYTTVEPSCEYVNDPEPTSGSTHGGGTGNTGVYDPNPAHQVCTEVEVEHTRNLYYYTYTVTLTYWKYRTFNSQYYTSDIEGAEYARDTLCGDYATDYSLAAKQTADNNAEYSELVHWDELEQQFASDGYIVVYPASTEASSVTYGGRTYDDVGEMKGDLVEEHDDGADVYQKSYSGTPTIVKRAKYWETYPFERVSELMLTDWNLYMPDVATDAVKSHTKAVTVTHDDGTASSEDHVVLSHYDVYGVDQNEDTDLTVIYKDFGTGTSNPNFIYDPDEKNKYEYKGLLDMLDYTHYMFEATTDSIGEIPYSDYYSPALGPNGIVEDDAGDYGYDGTLDLSEFGITQDDINNWASLNAYAKQHGLYFKAGVPARDNWCTNYTRYVAFMLYGVSTNGNGNQVVRNLVASHPNMFAASDTPEPGSIFSIGTTKTTAGSAAGHTGVILAVNGDTMTIAEGNADSNGAIRIHDEKIADYISKWGGSSSAGSVAQGYRGIVFTHRIGTSGSD